jgi:hypothetical protein
MKNMKKNQFKKKSAEIIQSGEISDSEGKEQKSKRSICLKNVKSMTNRWINARRTNSRRKIWRKLRVFK